MLRFAPLALASLFALGCSALVNPDGARLGGGGDGDGGVGGHDGGPITLVDAGDPRDDGGAPRPDGNIPREDGGPACTPSCDGDDFLGCGSGGTTRTPCPLGCDATSGAPHCLAMVPSNVPASLFVESAEDLSIEGGRFALDTTACAPERAVAHVVPQEDGPELCVLVVGALRIDPTSGLFVTGRRPLVILAAGEVRIEGLLDVSARLNVAGPGGGRGGIVTNEASDWNGAGPAGGIAGAHVDEWADAGGGGGGLCGSGGAGGPGGSAPGGEGGGPVPAGWELSPLVGGSGGGRGRGFNDASGLTNAGLGGAGGGAVQISSLVRVVLSGAITAGGGGGLGGNDLWSSSENYGSGGGGGSGGAVLIEAPEVRIEGPGAIVLAGGGGGAGVHSGVNGPPGFDGSTRLTGRALGGDSGSLFSTAANGGSGAGGDSLLGEIGFDGGGSENGGGGGGGAGCTVVRAAGSPAGMASVNPAGAPAYRALPLRLM